MSDWIPSQAGLRGDPKTRRATKALGESIAHTVGYLHCLWWWALEYAPDGDLEDFEAEDIADAAGWAGDPQTFVDALVNAGTKDKPGFLARDTGGRLIIHDWEDNQGDQFRARIQAAAKKRAQRAQKRADAGTEAPHDSDRVPECRDAVPISRDLARAKDRPTDRTDRTDSPPRAREEASRPVDNLASWPDVWITAMEKAGQPRPTRRQVERFVAEMGLISGIDPDIMQDTIARMVERGKGPPLLGRIYADVKAESEREIFAMQVGGGKRVR